MTMIKKTVIFIVLVASLFGLYKLWLYKTREKSCRDYAMAWLEIDEEHPLKGQEDTTGYSNTEKYKKMYEDCMFLQGY